jgi:hypothetical protein
VFIQGVPKVAVLIYVFQKVAVFIQSVKKFAVPIQGVPKVVVFIYVFQKVAVFIQSVKKFAVPIQGVQNVVQLLLRLWLLNKLNSGKTRGVL